MAIPHFGLFWQRIRKEFGKFQIHPPLGTVTEEFPTAGKKAGTTLGIELIDEPVVRCWFLDDKGNHIVQIQRDRFAYNWRKVTGEEPYPRYEHVRAVFEREWRRFCVFLTDEGMGSPEVNQCEVTYVNHIAYEKGWKSFGELNKVLASWSGARSGRFLPEPEKVSVAVKYVIPENQGRLHFTVQPVVRHRDAAELLQLNIVARGAPASSQIEDILQWMDLGRKWIVEGFTDFTTDSMHRLWGRTQ